MKCKNKTCEESTAMSDSGCMRYNVSQVSGCETAILPRKDDPEARKITRTWDNECSAGCDIGLEQRGSILRKALDVINGERQDSYGNPEDSFKLIGRYWTNYLVANELMVDDGELAIQPREVAEMMMLFKIARMSGQKPCEDNYTDLAGYAGIAGDMV